MNSSDFNKKGNAILKKYGVKNGVLNTFFGELTIKLDPSPKIKVWSVFMKLTGMQAEKNKLFNEWFSNNKFASPNFHSYKWNIHSNSAELALDELDERIDNLIYFGNNYGKENSIYN